MGSMLTWVIGLTGSMMTGETIEHEEGFLLLFCMFFCNFRQEVDLKFCCLSRKLGIVRSEVFWGGEIGRFSLFCRVNTIAS